MLYDLLIVLVIAMASFVGYKIGFVRCVSRLLCLVISVLVAKLLYKKVSEYVLTSSVGEYIRNTVEGSTVGQLEQSNLGFLQELAKQASTGISDVVIKILTIILIVVITYLITKFISLSFNVVAKLPVISFFNRTAGLVVGFSFGVIISYLVVAFVGVSYADWVQTQFETSIIAYTMSRENILLNLIF